MSSKSNKRKISAEKGSSSGQRPSVFERLGTKAEQRDQQSSSSSGGFCRHWNNTGNCPFGSSCKNAMHHTLISPSKQRAASKDREHNNSINSVSRSGSKQLPSSRGSTNRVPASAVPSKNPSSPPAANPASQSGAACVPESQGTAGRGPWEEEWSLEQADELELERRRQQLQRELELQMKKEYKKRKPSSSGGGANTGKKGSRSSSSSSSSSSGSSSSSSGSSRSSSSSRGRQAKPRSGRSRSKQSSRKSKRDSSKPSTKDSDMKKSRGSSKDSPKKRSSRSSPSHAVSSSSRQRSSQAPAKKRRESSSPESSGSERRKQSSQRHTSGSRGKGRSPSPERKSQQDRKRPATSHDKSGSSKRRDVSPAPRKPSLPPARSSTSARKRSASPPPKARRRSPSPAPAQRGRTDKRHESSSRNASPVAPRRRSPSGERKGSRRGHTPPSPDRYQQRGSGGRNSRRASPEPAHRNQSRDNRPRVQASGRDTRNSPEQAPRRPRAASREPQDTKRSDWGRGRDYANSPPRGAAHHRSSPDSMNGSSNRQLQDLRGDKTRNKDHDRDRDRRRDAPQLLDKGREKVRTRAEEGELPSLLSLMTQHPGHFVPQPPPGRPRPMPRDDSSLDHRGAPRGERARFDRYDAERGSESYTDHGGEDHHRGAKRGIARREPSPPPRQQQRLPNKPRDWGGEFPDNRGGRDWDRRGSGGKPGPAPPRQWGPAPGSEDAPRQNRLLPPLSVRNAMQAARRGPTANSPPPQEQADGASPSAGEKSGPEPLLAGDKPEQEDQERPTQEADRESVKAVKDGTIKRTREGSPEQSVGDEEPPCKRPCQEKEEGATPASAPTTQTDLPAAPAAPAMDLMESDLSDISDDADDFLNAEGVDDAADVAAEEKGGEGGAEGEDEEDGEEEQRVEDMLDNLDFEEISDGELEAEEPRGGVDALTVDWAALLSQTGSRDESREVRSHRWQGTQVLNRIGVSLAYCGPEVARELGIKVLGSSESLTETEGEGVQVLDPVAAMHAALLARKQRRSALFQLKDRRGLSSDDDMAFRRQLNGLPAKKSGHGFNQSVDPELFRHAVQLLTAT